MPKMGTDPFVKLTPVHLGLSNISKVAREWSSSWAKVRVAVNTINASAKVVRDRMLMIMAERPTVSNRQDHCMIEYTFVPYLCELKGVEWIFR